MRMSKKIHCTAKVRLDMAVNEVSHQHSYSNCGLVSNLVVSVYMHIAASVSLPFCVVSSKKKVMAYNTSISLWKNIFLQPTPIQVHYKQTLFSTKLHIQQFQVTNITQLNQTFLLHSAFLSLCSFLSGNVFTSIRNNVASISADLDS